MKRFNCDFASRFRILKGGKISLVVSALLGSAIIASAAPTGGVVTSGTANISQNGNVTNISQSTQKASINWQNFSIASNETVNFNQPNTNSITLNRVIGNEKSVINGALNANGQVWILNSNGILFNKDAKVNTSGIVATTAELSDKDFQDGNYNFKNSKSNSVVNLGTIDVSNNGYVVLASNEVRNAGTIKAIKGKVYLSGNSEYTINLNGNSIVNLIVTKGVLDAMVENSGTIISNGGEIYLTTNAVNELLKGVVNNTGVIEANSLDDVTGKIALLGEAVVNSGSLSATGTNEGGEILVGGDVHGNNTDVYGEAKYAILTSTSKIDASAIQNGNGGKVVVWSNLKDGITVANGSIKAEGGANGGNGGFIETSGHTLAVQNGIKVSTKAPKGTNGSWLLDPVDIEIYHATNNSEDNAFTVTNQDVFKIDNGMSYPNCIEGGCDPQRLYLALNDTATTPISKISDYTINAALDAGTSVFISTYKSGSTTGNGDITVSSGVDIHTSVNTLMDDNYTPRTLGLFAYRNIIIDGATIIANSSDSPLSIMLASGMSAITGLGNTYYYESWSKAVLLDSAIDENPTITDNEKLEATKVPGSGGYVSITDSNIYTQGGSFYIGGKGYNGFAVGDADHAGVLIKDSNIYTGGENMSGSITIRGANTSTGDGVRLDHAQLLTTRLDSQQSAGYGADVTILGISVGGNGVYSTSTTNGEQSYIDGINVYIDGSTTAAYDVANKKAAVNMEYTTIDSFEETILSGYNISDYSYYNYGYWLRRLDGTSNDPSIYRNTGTSGTQSIILGKSTNFNTQWSEELNLYLDSWGSRGVLFDGDSTDKVTMGGEDLYYPTHVAYRFYGAQGGEIDTVSFTNANSLTINSGDSGEQTANGSLQFYNMAGTYSWNEEWYDLAVKPLYLGGTTNPTNGIYISDDAIDKLTDATAFNTVYYGNDGESDVVVRNLNPTNQIKNVSIQGINVTLERGATVKTATGGYVLFATDVGYDADYSGTFINSGATFIGDGGYFVYVYDITKVTGDVPTIQHPQFSGEYNDYYKTYLIYDADGNDFNFSGGSALLCGGGACDSSTILLSYNLSDITSDYTYTGDEVTLSSLWSASSIFGSTYGSWVAGTDYKFIYNSADVTGFTDAGTYSGISVGILKSGYTVATTGTNTNGNFTITPKALTITASNKSDTYGNAVTLGQTAYTSSGLVSGQSIGNITLSSTGSTATANAGTYSIVASNAANNGAFKTSNYDITYVDGTLTKAKRDINLKVSDITTKTYDGVANSSGNGFIEVATPTQFVNGDTLDRSFVTSSMGYTFSTDGTVFTTSAKDAGTYRVNVSDVTSTNYNPTFANGSYVISPKALTISGTTVNSRVYDGGTLASLNNVGTLSDFVNQTDTDNISVKLTLDGYGSDIRFADSNVGTKDVNISWRLQGTGYSNYSLAQTTLTNAANITPRAITLISSNATKVYGNSEAALVVTASSTDGLGLASTDTISQVTGTLTRQAGENVGAYDIALGTGTKASNYTITFNTDNNAYTITKKDINILGLTGVDKIYDGTTTASLTGTATLDSSSIVSGDTSSDVSVDLTDLVGNFADKNVGTTKAITVSGIRITGAKAGNYNVGAVTGLTANITKADLTVSGASASNKVYDATTTASVTGGSVTALLSDAVTLSAANATFANKNVEDGKAVTTAYTISGNDAGNYNLLQVTGLTANITKADLIVSGLTVSNKTYDALTTAILGGTATITAIGSDNVILGGTVAGTFGDKNVGIAKAITITGNTISGTDAGNYNLIQQTGLIANITKADLTVSGASASNKVYDATTTASVTGGSVTALLSDAVTLSAANATFANKNVEDGKAVTTAYTISGTDAGNYNLIQQTGLTANIIRRTLNVTGLTIGSKTYDGTNSAIVSNAGTIDSVNGDDVSLSTIATFNNKNVEANKTVNLDYTLSGNDAGNYALSDITGVSTNALIGARTLNVTGLTIGSKTYDGTNSATVSNAGRIDSVNGDDVRLSTTATFNNKNVEANKTVNLDYTLSGNDAGNYSLANVTGVTTSALIGAQSTTSQVVLNKTNETTGIPVKLDGILNAEQLAQGTKIVVLDASNNDVTELALSGKIQPGKYSVKAINDNTNYSLTSNNVELTINPALDPITLVKTQVALPVIPVTTAPIVSVNTPATQNTQISNNLSVKLGITDNGNVNLVSQTVVGQPNQVVTLSELKTSSQENSNANEKKEVKLEDVRVSLNQNSIVQIVNGGVSLPTGVDQQFYVVKQDINTNSNSMNNQNNETKENKKTRGTN